VNPFAVVAIIIAVFFVAGLMVGFLIVMALPALVAHRGKRRVAGPRGGSERGGSRRTYDGQRPRWPEPQGWTGTQPFGAGLDGEDDDADDTDGLGDLEGPPGGPRWRDNK
jgi:hypothetical protein